MKKIVILGAGISGLSLGWFLKKKFLENCSDQMEITIIEARESPGGWIRTIEKDGFLFELGPRSCRVAGTGIGTLQLIEELNLEEELILADPVAQNRFIYLNRKMERLPNNFSSFFSSSFKRGLLKDLTKGFIKDIVLKSLKKGEEEESVEAFISRKFSPKIASQIADPLISGIFAGDISKLSFKSCFPRLYQLDQNGSLLKGTFFSRDKTAKNLSSFVKKIKKEKIFSFKNGMQTLTDALAQKLKKELLLSKKVKSIHFVEKKVQITLMNDELIEADYLFSTFSPKVLSEIILNQDFKRNLEHFSSTSVAVVSIGFKKQLLKEEGFGYLIPSSEKEAILGVVFDSSVFKLQNKHPKETRLTIMIGGEHFKDFDTYKSENFIEIALKSLVDHLNIKEVPDVVHVEIAKNAIPQYLVGYEKKVSELNPRVPSFMKLTGSSFFGVSVNDCIANSKAIVEQFFLEKFK